MSRCVLAAPALLLLISSVSASAATPTRCLKTSGAAAFRCLKAYSAEVQACRDRADTVCEETLRLEGGTLDARVGRIAAPVQQHCDAASATRLGYLSVDDIVLRDADACRDFAEDLLDTAFADDLAALSSDELACQRRVADRLALVRNRVVREFGVQCFLRAFAGHGCNREARDRDVARASASERERILKACGPAFDALNLSRLDPGNSTREERVAEVLARVENRSKHFAQMVYPPNDLGPTSEFGPFPVGVTTLSLADLSRTNVPDTGPRPVLTEVYYPSTDAAIQGVPRDVIQIFGIEIAETPAFRDVERAAGTYPLIVFSHGNTGIRVQSVFFATHLASHGFVVATPDHHGNTFIDAVAEIFDPFSAENRPLDMSFLIDQMLALSAGSGGLFEGAIDSAKIGASGHSFGGFTTFVLTGAGPFQDARIRAAFPQAPASQAFTDAFFSTITIPTLVIGGSLDETTPFDPHQQRPFEHLPTGAAIVGLANVIDAGHFTFSDFCEVPRDLLAFLGGFDEACEPRHLPWRHAHDVINFLGLNFFDAVLNGNTDALDRLDPARLESIEDLSYQSK